MMTDSRGSVGTNPPPVFVGGTGRSGTTVIAELLGQHSDYYMVPIEARFHVDRNGLFDAIAGNCTLQTFAERMRNEFFERSGPNEQPRGLHQILEREQLEEALAGFESRFYQNRFEAARALFGDLFDPLARKAGKAAWVEMTPGNAVAASRIFRVFPESKIVHTVRDGRDVAASVVAKQWGPENIVDGLYWWAERLRDAEADARMAPGDIHLVRFDELIYGRRQTALKLLTAYLGIEPDDSMLTFFNDSMIPSKAHLGRWRRSLSDDEAAAVDAVYRSLLDGLRSDGVGFLPVEPDAVEKVTEQRAQG